jgi:hypothetical protein
MKTSVMKLLLCLAILLPVTVSAQKVIEMKGSFLTQLQKRDSILIADQLKYGFKLNGVKEGTKFLLPDYSKNFMDSLEVEAVSPWTIDTVKVIKGKRNGPKEYNIEGSVIVSAFKEGKYTLPRIAIGRVNMDGKVDTLIFDPQTMDVKTMPVDTTTYKMHDIKGQIRYPLTLKEILPYIVGFDLFATLVIAIVCLIMIHKKKEAGVTKSDEPAHIVALRKLDHYRGDKYWSPEKQKIFYSGITDALREYIVARYGVEAMEMTTAEIFSDLKDKGIPKELFDELRGLFERADYVKFAKHTADNDENAAALPLAVRFVTSTYQEQLDQDQADATAQPQPAASEAPQREDDSAYMPK